MILYLSKNVEGLEGKVCFVSNSLFSQPFLFFPLELSTGFLTVQGSCCSLQSTSDSSLKQTPMDKGHKRRKGGESGRGLSIKQLRSVLVPLAQTDDPTVSVNLPYYDVVWLSLYTSFPEFLFLTRQIPDLRRFGNSVATQHFP